MTKIEKMINLFKSVYKSYSKELCQKLFSMKQFIEVYRMIRESGILENMIDSYSVLSNSKDIYLSIGGCIAEGRTHEALRNKTLIF